MAIPDDVVRLIDDARRRGMNYDDVVAAVQHTTGQPPKQTERLLQEYRKLALPDGRPREQVNLGDPAEQPHG
jgi:hypothetical protein